MMIKSVYYHAKFMVYSRGQMNENQRIYGNLRGWEGRSSRGLAREVFKGVCILFGVRFGGFYGCHSPFPGVSVVFAFLEVSEGVYHSIVVIPSITIDLGWYWNVSL